MANPIVIAAQVARRIIPDLEGQALYLIEPADGEMITKAMLGPKVGGFSVDNLCAMLQPELEAKGRWRGPGAAVVVDTSSIGIAELHEFDRERWIVGCALHELAHWIDRLRFNANAEPIEPAAAAIEYTGFVERRTKELESTAPAPKIPGVYWSHGMNWNRICAHLWYRLRTQRGGYTLRPKWLTFGADYPELEMLATPSQIINSLEDEFEPLADRPLRDLADIAPPQSFVDVWNEGQNRVWARALEAAA